MCGASGKQESGQEKKLLRLKETEGQVKGMTALGHASTAIIKCPLAYLQPWESACPQIAPFISRVTPFLCSC